MNFAGAQYTLYSDDNKVVAVAELDKNGNIAKILYSYSNSEWITKNYFELGSGQYYLKETKAPANGYFTLSNKNTMLQSQQTIAITKEYLIFFNYLIPKSLS